MLKLRYAFSAQDSTDSNHLSEAVTAFPSCYHKDHAEYGKLTQKVVEYMTATTPRQTTEEYAHAHDKKAGDVAASIAATGRLTCEAGGTLSANLVLKGDLILTAGHALTYPDTCKEMSKPNNCMFQAGNQKLVRIKELVASGNKCPQKKVKDSDRAILRLEHVVDGVVPYKIENPDARSAVKTRSVKAVEDHSIDFRKTDPKTGQVTMPRHIQDCSIKRVFYKYDPIVVASDCDGSFGNSGGALLSDNLNEHVLLGLSFGGAPQTKLEIANERRTGISTRKPYDDDVQHASAVAIDGKLRDELLKAAR